MKLTKTKRTSNRAFANLVSDKADLDNCGPTADEIFTDNIVSGVRSSQSTKDVGMELAQVNPDPSEHSQPCSFPRLTPEDPSKLFLAVAAKAKEVVDAFKKKELYQAEAILCLEQNLPVDPCSFDFAILHALDCIENLINPNRDAFDSPQRRNHRHKILDCIGGPSIQIAAASCLLRLHDSILQELGVEQEISTAKVLAKSSFPYEFFLWAFDPLELEFHAPELLSNLLTVADDVILQHVPLPSPLTNLNGRRKVKRGVPKSATKV